MLVDRGFARHSILYPNKNFHSILPLQERRPIHEDERRKDKTLCRLRWVNEANFSRMLYVRGLQDIVGWHFVPLIPAAVSWGFAMSNLQQPWGDTPASPRVGACEGHGDPRSEDEGNGSEDDITYLGIPIATILCVPPIVMTSVTRTTVSTLPRRINGSTHQIGAERGKGASISGQRRRRRK